jgi:hypothetical protein
MMLNLTARAVPLVRPRRLDDVDARWEYTAHYSFAIPTPDLLDAIADHAPHGVIEEAAGGGYLAALLRAHGVPRVRAFDLKPTPPPAQPAFGTLIPGEYNQHIAHSWGDVHAGGAGQSALFPELTLLLCWPPEASPAALDSLAAYQGDTVALVAELPEDVDGRQPHTAEPLFFRHLRAGFALVERVAIPQWEAPGDGEHDTLTVWRRK